MVAIPPATADNYVNLGEQAHVPILHQALAPLLGDLSGRSLLDFGCGDGRLTCRVAAHRPVRILAMDENERLLIEAGKQAAELPADLASRIEFALADESVLPLPGGFDIVLCSLMLMMCDSRERLDRVVRGLVESLAPRPSEGQLLLILTHPCFRSAMHATFHNDLPEDFSYWQSGRAYDVVITPAEQQVKATLSDYHWTLSDYADAIAEAGGLIRRLIEVGGQYDPQGQPIGLPAYLILSVSRG